MNAPLPSNTRTLVLTGASRGIGHATVKKFGASGAGLPVTKGSESSITDPNLQAVLAGKAAASYVQLWLDTTYGPTVGGAMNDGIVNLFAGKGQCTDCHAHDARGDSYSGAPDLTAKIYFISTTAEYTQPVIYSLDERNKLVYLIQARPSRPDSLRVGQPISVYLNPKIPVAVQQ